MSKNTKTKPSTSNPSPPAQAGQPEPMLSNFGGAMEGVQTNQKPASNNPALSVTMGQSKNPVDAHMASPNDAADKKGGASKDAAGASSEGKGINKLKDPNSAHEILDIAKNVP